MAATIRDVAKHAGVGVGTVSRVLNGNPSVRNSTRSKVLAAIEELDFVPNAIARRLSLGKTLAIGVIAPFFTRPSVGERIRGIEQVLAESEYDLQLFNVESVERRDSSFRNISRRERVDGLIVISLTPDDQHAERLRQANVPTVLLDAYHELFSNISIDDVMGGREATAYLIGLGHSRIAFLSDNLDNPFGFTANRDRFEGYRQALAQSDISFKPEYRIEGRHGRLAAYALTQKLLDLPDPPTAIFATSDIQAIGALQAADDLNLDVPEDLSVVGYDDIEVAEYVKLTTMRQPLLESGIRSIQLLLEEIDTPPDSPQHISLQTQLIVRETTAAPPGR